MAWARVQLKYQLIHISEILMIWARFNKSDQVEVIERYRVQVLTENLEYNELEKIKSEFWTLIVQSNDTGLYRDLVQYYPVDTYNFDPSEVSSLT